VKVVFRLLQTAYDYLGVETESIFSSLLLFYLCLALHFNMVYVILLCFNIGYPRYTSQILFPRLTLSLHSFELTFWSIALLCLELLRRIPVIYQY